MKKSLPLFKSDADAEEFLDHDLTDYLHLDHFKSVSFEFLPKTENINLRVSMPLLTAIKDKAAQSGMPYQKFIRLALEQAVRSEHTLVE